MIIPVFLCIIWQVNGAVLDPSLYLSPSPPLSSTNDASDPEYFWSTPTETRVERDTEDEKLLVLPFEKHPTSTTLKTTAEPSETMEGAETFWPSLPTTNYGLRGIHIPLTFSLTGVYGGHRPSASGVIASSYGSVSNDGLMGLYGNYGKSGLAGSSYGSYAGYPGTRIYGASGGTGWSGWGNGKWGHYGKG